LPACTDTIIKLRGFSQSINAFFAAQREFLNALVSGNAAVLDVNHVRNYLFFHAIGVIFASAAHGARK
jgi:hypothetical protein